MVYEPLPFQERIAAFNIKFWLRKKKKKKERIIYTKVCEDP